MERIDIRLKESDRQILKSIIGKTLDCIEHDEFTFTDSSSQVVKMFFARTIWRKLQNKMENSASPKWRKLQAVSRLG